MNAPAKVLLKTASILFILGGVLLIVLSIVFGFLGNAAASSGAAVGTVIGALFILITLAAVLAGVIMLVIGILGVPNKRCNDPGKAGFYIVTGIILCILILGYIFYRFPWAAAGGKASSPSFSPSFTSSAAL